MGSFQRSILDVCILIPCFNNIKGLIESINSIDYHPGRFLILVVDDGSITAVSRNELYKHVPITVNIQIVRLRQNLGITRALNKGLDFIYANYPARFIARLDCGDTCNPARFYRQVSFLNNNPGTDLLGTWCYFKDLNSGFAYEYSTPTQHELIERSMYFRNVFVHPTVMWRISALDTFRYPEKYPHAEDYGLFYDMISKKRTAVIDAFLVTCEINTKGISFQNRSEQLKSRMKVIWDYGKNKWWLAAGTIKLVLLMALPYRFIYLVKKKVYKFRPGA
jgi:glycosyltransferase involved in cell wall biosynthesis